MDVKEKILEQIVSKFKISGNYIKGKPFGNGHINNTFLVTILQEKKEKKYILRKINKYVFKNPEVVVSNTVNVINHISNKLKKNLNKEIVNNVLQLIETMDNKYYYVDENKDYWCAVSFIENAYTVEFVETPEQAYNAAKAFGEFQKYLIDADVSKYKETIPNFHNLESRLVSFNEALKKDIAGRVETVEKEIEIIKACSYLSEKITSLLHNKKLPKRITHNDTKINNVMLNKETNKGQCVIDLDTVMPGTVLYDFGDMVRTSTSPVEEDEKDLSKVTMRINIFEALVKGYLEELSGTLDELEIDNFVYGVQVIVFEQAVRFLTDYLMNDIYYTTKYHEHNLVRARTQFALLESIETQLKSMNEIIEKYR